MGERGGITKTKKKGEVSLAWPWCGKNPKVRLVLPLLVEMHV